MVISEVYSPCPYIIQYSTNCYNTDPSLVFWATPVFVLRLPPLWKEMQMMQQLHLLIQLVITDSTIRNVGSHWFNSKLERVFTTNGAGLNPSTVTPQNAIEERVMEKQIVCGLDFFFLCPTTSVGTAPYRRQGQRIRHNNHHCRVSHNCLFSFSGAA